MCRWSGSDRVLPLPVQMPSVPANFSLVVCFIDHAIRCHYHRPPEQAAHGFLPLDCGWSARWHTRGRPNGSNESFEGILVIRICGIDALRCGADDILCMPSSRDCSESRARGSGYWSWGQRTATEEDGDAARNVWLSNMDMSLSNLAIGNCAAFEATVSQFPRD